MSSIQIVECSKFNGKGTNSSWRNVFADPIRVNKGDVLQVKQIFLDTNSNVSDNIEIKEDTELELKFGYYFINSHTPAESKKTYAHWGTANKTNYETYIARYGDNSAYPNFTPVIRDWKYTLKAGIYSASNLAETITRAMTELKFDTVMPYSRDSVAPRKNFILSTYDEEYGDVYYFYKPDVTRAEYDAGNQPYFTFHTLNTDGTMNTYWMGSQIQTLLWNRKGNNRFEIVSHTPVLYQAQQVVNIRRDEPTPANINGTHYIMFNRRTGCYFTEMNPPSFWNETLGFNPDDILVKFDANGYDLTDDTDLDKLSEKTTGGMISITNCFIDPTTTAEVASIASNWVNLSTPADDYSNYTKTNGENYTIEATKSYDALASGGYYLVSCSGFNNKFAEDTQTRRDIQAVVSRQYDTNNFITAQSGSGIDWENTGESFLLSDIQIQILDPETKKPAEDLGEKSAVFLQLIKSGVAQK
ncbi:MAG: hypothetical protein CMB97_00345 [Flavobacteriaceae bacterium]|nr:hypothetical protein [Flavobacteriaceae bacterium]